MHLVVLRLRERWGVFVVWLWRVWVNWNGEGDVGEPSGRGGDIGSVCVCVRGREMHKCKKGGEMEKDFVQIGNWI